MVRRGITVVIIAGCIYPAQATTRVIIIITVIAGVYSARRVRLVNTSPAGVVPVVIIVIGIA